MCRAIDVAAYILNERGRLSGFQLQKLLYYSQVWCLVTQDRQLFAEDIRAWEHGPVVYEVARAHRGCRTVVASDIDGDPFVISAEDQVVIDAVLESYGSMTGDELAELTHREDPWRDAFNGETGLASNVISLDSICAYYSELISGDSEVARRHHVPNFPVAPRVVVTQDDYDWITSIL